MTTTLTASTTAQLNHDIATANAATSGGFIIDLQGNITETTQLDAIDLQSGVSLTIDGSNGSGGIHTLNGAGSHGFVVDAGSVTIENLGLRNAVLSGGSSSATVTLANDSFSRNVTIAHNLTVDQIAPVTQQHRHQPSGQYLRHRRHRQRLRGGLRWGIALHQQGYAGPDQPR
jgi:hypothetical protein